MENQLQQIGRRIKEARTVLDISVEEMAKLHNLTEAEYLKHENGEVDSTYMFFNRCAKRFNMDLGALITGESPHLSFYTVTRKGYGMPICRREGFDYLHKAVHMKNRQAEPFLSGSSPYFQELFQAVLLIPLPADTLCPHIPERHPASAFHIPLYPRSFWQN